MTESAPQRYRYGNGATTIQPFCQIVGRMISAQNCLETQGQPACFGCAAPTRMCELCRKNSVDVPAVGMCSQCLNQEIHEGGPPIPNEKVSVECQIAKNNIAVTMCLAMQGQEGCRNCPAPSRLCEKCHARSSRFPQYGLCLVCSVIIYGEGWQPSPYATTGEPTTQQDESEDDKEIPQQDTEEPADDEVEKETNPSTSERKEEQMRTKKDKKKSPGRFSLRMIKRHLPRAEALIRKTSRPSVTSLQKKLHTGFETARELMRQQIEKGLVASHTHPSGKVVYYKPARSAKKVARKKIAPTGSNHAKNKPMTPADQSFTATEKVEELQKLIEILGKNSRPAPLLQAVIADLKAYNRLRTLLQKLKIS